MSEELKDRIRKERIKKDLNQPQLAKLMNVSKQTVSNWENGNRIPDTNTVLKLANEFAVTTDYLLGRTDDPKVEIHKTTIDGHEYEIGLYKGMSPQEVNILIEKLKEYHFDVDKIIDEMRKEATEP